MSRGGMPDMGALMRQAQKLQADMAKAQEQIAAMTCEAASGGGMVSATVNGTFDVVKIKIEPTVVDPADIGMLEDLVTAAVNLANAKMRDLTKEKMAKIMPAGMPGMPGMF
ncbi:MAG: YbaB/EbfC family nucleoid-associated protein [Kofleriaceae bacterium]|jgi:nucleoid-associated protein EbfC|nr:YbaB/EbfC family nucleoid-associated protein [Kofleriaceae bacterium]